MSEQATDLGLFLRAATERVPYPSSVAVDLTLRAAGPRADRPWACRVSTSLLRPGANGLATDVTDIERLTELGRVVLARLPDVTCAAVTTVGGRRTWLLYAAGPDLPTVTATVRSTVRLAFAEQVDYVPHVTVEHDPAWAGYAAACPTAAELADLNRRRAEANESAAARTATDAAVARWTAAGHPPGGVATLTYRLAFPTDTARALLLTRVFACQFRPSRRSGPRPADPDGDVTAALDRDGPVDAATIGQVERWLTAEGRRVGGRYLGWFIADADAVAAPAVDVDPAVAALRRRMAA